MRRALALVVLLLPFGAFADVFGMPGPSSHIFDAGGIFGAPTNANRLILDFPFTSNMASTVNGVSASVSRAQAESYVLSGTVQPTLFYAPSNTGAFVPPYGLQVWQGTTNYVLQSENFDSAAGWNQVQVTPTLDAAQFVDGNTTMDQFVVTSTAANVFRTTALSSSAGPFTAHVWPRAASGTAVVTVGVSCTAVGGPVVQRCGRSDGGSCTTGTSGTVGYANATVGTDPVRLSVTVTCGSALTNPAIIFHPGLHPTTTIGDTAIFGGAMLETTTDPTPYIPTTTAAAPRAADITSAPVPAVLTPASSWCLDALVTPGPYPTTSNIMDLASVRTRDFLAWGAGVGAPNTARIVVTGTRLGFVVYDNASASREISTLVAPSAGAHRLTGCYVGGTGIAGFYVDGVSTGSPLGAGTGIVSSLPATLYIGTTSGGATATNGWLRNVRLCRGTAAQCLAIPSL